MVAMPYGLSRIIASQLISGAPLKFVGKRKCKTSASNLDHVAQYPPEWHLVMAFVMPLLFILLVGIPVANILHRAGRSRWWTILAFLPFLNLIGLWVFAFTRWPKAAN